MNIVLIGYRCTGKTAVGKRLARELGKAFIDTDRLIEEETGCSLEAVVAARGWNHFREIEKGLIETTSEKDDQVIATGGGVVMDEENVRNLKRNGWVIWLQGRPEVLKVRMENEQRSGRNRPSLTGLGPMEEIAQVLRIRNPYYEQAASFVVDTSYLSPKDVVASIMKALPQG